ncbi:uncharacterized protein LOC119603422 isoform X2 [Lucilia sericata]|nr:uncharacterized protein LOC119603422 isoform X2 [Lucilia sericata]
MVTNPILEVPNPPAPVFKEPILTKPLLNKPQKTASVSKKLNSPPPLYAKPAQPIEKKPFNISLADKLINLLNETVLNPIFMQTEEDNIVIIKNTGSSNIETSSFLKNFMNCDTPKPKKAPETSKINTSATAPYTSNRHTRPIYTLNYGQQNVPSRRPSFSGNFLPPTLLKNTKLQKRVAKRTLKEINAFEKVYKTVKTRPPKVLGSGVLILDDLINTNKANERQTLNQTPLSRCLRRTESMVTEPDNRNFSLESAKQKPIELVFEFTPEDIIVSLLEYIKDHPVLWEFHNQPFNKMYNKAIEEICTAINSKWSLNITPLKMRRSINRILRFYRLMLPRESIDHFEEYFNKCALFLPTSIDKIPRARCDYCAVCYETDSELRKHLIEKHKSLKWPYKCQQCRERFRERDEYELHKHLPHYEEIIKCEQCHKRFNRRNLYNKHISSHEQTLLRRLERTLNNQKPVKVFHACKFCSKTFSNSEYLNRHELIHTRRFNCNLCFKTFSLKSTLKEHLRRHSQTLDYMCEVCGKGFIRKSSLREHMDTHTGEKITCNICNLRLRKCSLPRHLRLVHVATEGTIESTFRSRCYQYKKYLYPTRQGIKRVENLPRQYVCKICKISFDRLKLLKDHNKEFHTDVHKTPCKICNFEFKYIPNLKRHYKYKHNLHKYQIFKLVDQNEDLNTVLAMNEEELEKITHAELVAKLTIEQSKAKNYVSTNDKNYFEPERMNSNKIQDEIMKAVESIDQQDIKIDDDHSMNEFFTDLLKQ